jgi:hypothetical protein
MKKHLEKAEIKFLLILSIAIFALLIFLSFLHFQALVKRSNARTRLPTKIEINPGLPSVKGARSQTIIEGSLSYPSSGIPENLIVCAQNLKTDKTYCTQGHIGDPRYLYGVGYKLIVAPGTYYLYSHLREPDFPTGYQDYKAYYSEAVVCGLTVECGDHTPIPVTVAPGQRLQNINPIDWYDF